VLVGARLRDRTALTEGERVAVVAIGVLEAMFLVAFISMFLVIVEWIATLRFAEWAFRIGPRVLGESRTTAVLPSKGDSPFETEFGMLKQIGPEQFLFRSQSRGLSILDSFAVKGSMRLAEGNLVVEGRVPLGTTIFLTSWLIGWAAGSFAMGVSGRGVLAAVALASLAVMATLAVLYAVIPFEVRRARRIVDEFLEPPSEVALGGKGKKAARSAKARS
jgi:hypothetical protein